MLPAKHFPQTAWFLTLALGLVVANPLPARGHSKEHTTVAHDQAKAQQKAMKKAAKAQRKELEKARKRAPAQ